MGVNTHRYRFAESVYREKWERASVYADGFFHVYALVGCGIRFIWRCPSETKVDNVGGLLPRGAPLV